MASRAHRLLGHVRVTHPFPSVLDGLVAAGAALAAGAGAPVAVRIGVSMVLLQASVGALNDVIDAPHDAGRKPGKPIPAGLVRPSVAQGIAAIAGALGVALAVPSGPATALLAVGLLALGYAYDLWFKGTAWSWVPFALAIPLFPTFGWLGGVGWLPPVWAVLLPTAVLAGTGLALANAVVDIERDASAGASSVAVRLGRRRAVRLNVALLLLVCGLAAGTLIVARGAVPWLAGIALAATLVLAGWHELGSEEPQVRERGWRTQAIGVAVVAGAWLAGMAATGWTASPSGM